MPMTQQKTWRAGRFWWDSARTGRRRRVSASRGGLRPRRPGRRRMRGTPPGLQRGLRRARPGLRVVCHALSPAAGPERRTPASLGRTAQARRLHRVRCADPVACRRHLHDQDDDARRDDPRRRPGAAAGAGRPCHGRVHRRRLRRSCHRWPAKLGGAVGATTGRRRVSSETVVTADDVKKPMPDPEAFRTALWELGIPAENALAVTGSASGLRAATSTGLATVVITGDGAPDIPAAVAVRPDYRRQRAAAYRGLPAAARPLVLRRVSRLTPRRSRGSHGRLGSVRGGTHSALRGQLPRSSSITALKSLSAWSAAYLA